MKYVIKEEENRREALKVQDSFRIRLPILLLVFSAVITAVGMFVQLPLAANAVGIVLMTIVGLAISAGMLFVELGLGINKKFAIIISACNFVFFMLGTMGGMYLKTWYLVFGIVGAIALYLVNFDFKGNEWKQSKRLRTLAIVGLAALVVMVAASCFVYHYEGGVTYRLNGDAYEVVAASNAISLEVKSEINGKPVTTVKAYAFSKNTFTKKLVLPNSVTKIEKFAFTGMGGIQDLTLNPSALPSGLLYLAWGPTDADVQYLSDRHIPHSLTKVTVTASVPDSCFAFMFQLKEINFTEGVKNIQANAFVYCVGLRTVVLPNSLRSIGDYAFAYCTGLTNEQARDEEGKWLYETLGGQQVAVYTKEGIILNDGLKKIGNYAFLKCTNLREVVIPSSVVDMGSYVFDRCNSASFQIRVKNTSAGITYVAPAYNEDGSLSSNISGWSQYWRLSASLDSSFDEYGYPTSSFEIGNVVYNPDTVEI